MSNNNDINEVDRTNMKNSLDNLQNYLHALIPASLMVDSGSIDRALRSNSTSSEELNTINNFITDPKQQVLYICKQRDGSILFLPEVTYSSGTSSAVLIKRERRKIEHSCAIAEQVNFAVLNGPPRTSINQKEDIEHNIETPTNDGTNTNDNLLGSNPLSSMYSYMNFGFSPFLKSFSMNAESALKISNEAMEEPNERPGSPNLDTNEQDEENSSSKDIPEALKQSLPTISKRLNELNYALKSCLDSMEIPEVKLLIDPVVVEAYNKRLAAGKELSLDEMGLGEDVRDDKMLNRLQAGVNRWIKEIQNVTKLERDASSGSVSNEVQFWLNLDHALVQIQRQVDGPEVKLTLDILKQSRRTLASVLFAQDTGIKVATKRVANYKILMNDFPIGTLMAATDIPQIEEAIDLVFLHMKKLKTADEYPLIQALRLVDALSRDLLTQIIEVLTNECLVSLPFENFKKIVKQCEELFRAWNQNVGNFRDLARDLAKRRGNERLPPKSTPEHAPLADRISDLKEFRASHEHFKEVLEKTIIIEEKKDNAFINSSGNDKSENKENKINQQKLQEKVEPSKNQAETQESNLSLRDEINIAYDHFRSIDILDISRDGNVAWDAAKAQYERKVDRIERKIIERLVDKLGSAENATEMFRVFNRFNPLFFRRRIRGAIQQFQIRLIGNVEADIKALQNKFKQSYQYSQASIMSNVIDVPPVSGAIIWAKQIERQLDTYLKRVGDVLGPGWEQHLEGRKLQEIGKAFKEKLNTRQMFDHWVRQINDTKQLLVTGRLFCVEEIRNKTFQLVVNFDHQIVELFKEVRNLQWLGFKVPVTLKFISDEARLKYPHATNLQSLNEMYSVILDSLDDELKTLLALQIDNVRSCVEKSFLKRKSLTWDSDDKQLGDYCSEFAQHVYTLQNKLNDTIDKTTNINTVLVELKQCPYDAKIFCDKINSIQLVVDAMNLASYSNLEYWVKNLENRIDSILKKRLTTAIQHWMSQFENCNWSNELIKNSNEFNTDNLLINESSIISWHEIVLRKHVLDLAPPLEEARSLWISSLHNVLAVVCNLPRLQSSRYDTLNNSKASPNSPNNDFDAFSKTIISDKKPTLQLVSATAINSTFISLLSQSGLKNGSNEIYPRDLLKITYQAIEKRMVEVKTYVQTWFQYQALWDMEAAFIFEHLGKNLTLWQKLLSDIQEARSTFDTSGHERKFGSIIVDYKQVQAQVSMRYDAWQKEILTKFVEILGTEVKDCFKILSKLRNELEKGSFDGPTEQMVAFITVLNGITNKKMNIEEQIVLFIEGEKLLQRRRFELPNDWMWVSNLQGEFDAFVQILNRKTKAMESERLSLQNNVVAESNAIEARVVQLRTDWQNAELTKGNQTPKEVLNILGLFDDRIIRLNDEWRSIQNAKIALDIAEELSIQNEISDSLEALGEEAKSLREVWIILSEISLDMDKLRELPWSAVVPKKLRNQLDEIIETLRKVPSRIQQYEAFEYMLSKAREFKKSHALIIELRSEALKERHWRDVMKVLQLQKIPFKDLSLGNLWEKSLIKHQRSLSDIFRTAQGEMALEEYLRQIKEYWGKSELELVNFQNRCRIIKGWNDFLANLDEQMQSLLSMKQSPYFRVFEDEASNWESKLTRLRLILDLWIDVQRRWVYLSGILLGSADIKQQLPNEFARFQSIDNEFVTLMRKVGKTPRLLEFINSMPNLEHSLTRLADLLEKIQRALGEYLERQRQSFSRFYFVGDEDLLEIIGNSKDPSKVQRHMSKMFAGIVSLGFDKNYSIVKHITSREGEEVDLKSPVSVNDMKVNDWLKLLEDEMRKTLLSLLKSASSSDPFNEKEMVSDTFTNWLNKYPAQIIILASQLSWSTTVSFALQQNGNKIEALAKLKSQTNQWLELLASRVLSGGLKVDVRKKYEQLITEMVHQRDVIRKLCSYSESSDKSYEWLSQLRYEWQHEDTLQLSIAAANFQYGFEYQGVGERLVQTPLTDRCYLALTQAMHFRLGGNPFGPAGTGKTESVKALGAQLGRFVLVFNCDEHFDLMAMGRIFVGLCQVGAWGCFDEFNRLEERILSAVSQQILNIQQGLLQNQSEIMLLNKSVQLNSNMGIFVTMNPGYAGRSNLPDNLKQLFRAIAMIEPNRDLIGQVMLFSQGYKTAEKLSSKIVLLYKLCKDQLSEQPHYDFGLRAVKSVLLSAGQLKRSETENDAIKNKHHRDIDEGDLEEKLLIQAVCDNMLPKLVSEDIALFQTLLIGVFPGATIKQTDDLELRKSIDNICAQWCLQAREKWIGKVLQLYRVQKTNHGIMMVGPSGSGKTSSWRVLLKAMEMIDGVKGQAYVIDPKAIKKEYLYGSLDPNTLEWTNGIFTHILRTILNNVRGEDDKRHWIIFDGDVDPEWAENLNSVLDDNKLLTLPNGERLNIPDNVRIMFEVETLKYATLATVSRCGMIWFNENTLTLDEIFDNRLKLILEGKSSANIFDESFLLQSGKIDGHKKDKKNDSSAIQIEESKSEAGEEDTQGQFLKLCKQILQPFLQVNGLAQKMLVQSLSMPHVMEVSQMRLIVSFFSLLLRGIKLIQEYNQNHLEFPMEFEHMSKFLSRWTLFSILWGFGGSLDTNNREKLSSLLCNLTTTPLPNDINSTSLWAFQVKLSSGDWVEWKESVPRLDIEPHKVMDTDVVISTLDTLRHVEVLKAWLDDHRPIILCGPPGSGKTMSLNSVLNSMPNFELASLNFSSATTPDLILKTFEQYCVYKPTRSGFVLAPAQPDSWLVVFCDEVNLPAADSYGTQHVITFLRQVVEQGGFWRSKGLQWVTVERIQFVAACNPPTDPGRVPLSLRFLRHTSLLLVDYPVEDSLRQIYGTFNRALLKLQPLLRAHGDSLTEAMVQVYSNNKKRFSADTAPHYVYSPRELSRWMRALFESLEQTDDTSVDQLIRLWFHEGLRLFHDRLITKEEREWCINDLEQVAKSQFVTADHGIALARPILFANWLSKSYVSVDQNALREYVSARLRVFYEEELNVPLVVFDDVLEHVLRIDRVLRQPLGHLLLVGMSGAGKTVLSRFVSWMNGLKVFQIKLSRKYSLNDFDEDLRHVMKLSGCQGEKVCFIFDESNILDAAFLERMNALLASGEVPGLFEGDEYISLMSACRETSQGGDMDSSDETHLFKEFTRNVQRNLHVVFTMNPASSDMKNRAATSPALFNRCVVDWFGDWSYQALCQVGYEFTNNLDLEANSSNYLPPSVEAGDKMKEVQVAGDSRNDCDQIRYRDAVVTCLVCIHESVQRVSRNLSRRHENHTYVSPRDYIDLINHYVELYNKKRSDLEEQQLHLNIGLEKLSETAVQVEELRKSLAVKEQELDSKSNEANAKLQQMVNDQNEAENKKVEAEKLGASLNERNSKVALQREEAEKELSSAEPALLDAQSAVSNIKKANLVEMQSLNNPPSGVKMTMEAVCLLLGVDFTGWVDIRRVINKREFIPDIVNFKSENITDDARRKVKKMLENPDFNEDKVFNANKACLPLFQWISSQLMYAGILLKIKPLRDEIATLADESVKLTEQYDKEMKTVSELEVKIAQLKEEYAVLIGETEVIKSQMVNVKTKVERSSALLESLTQENDRWTNARIGFGEQMNTLVGDTLISAAFVSYSGFFGYKQRQNFLTEWKGLLSKFGIAFKPDIALVEYLSKPNDRLNWLSNDLPNDYLCLENAIILERFNRFPLVIDPSGQAVNFLSKYLADRKVMKTSFLDSSFMKQLESALRFGTCLIITDVENIDPILNPVLNREIHRTGGRSLVRLGDQDIDFSPSFSMYLTTRDSTFQFAPDVCSRVTFVNFTVTPTSLQSQCLSKVLKTERPDVDKQREDLLKLQGEYVARLRDLEEKLLDSLNEVKGNILDDDKVVKTLETLKNEAKVVLKKAEEADEVMKKVETVSAFYTPFAAMCSKAYFALEKMVDLHFSYHFSLDFFFQILNNLFSPSNLEKIGTDYSNRLDRLTKKFFNSMYYNVKQALLEKDKLVWGFMLANIRHEVKSNHNDNEKGKIQKGLLDSLWFSALSDTETGSINNEVIEKEIDALLKKDVFVNKNALINVLKLPLFQEIDLLNQLNNPEWLDWIRTYSCKSSVPPHDRFKELNQLNLQLHVLHLLKALKPNMFLSGIKELINSIFEYSFIDDNIIEEGNENEKYDAILDISKTILNCNPKNPVLFLSTQGFDMSKKIDDLAIEMNIRCRSVAMGSPEGFVDAEKAISSGSQSGGWVMLKNVHLATEWLQSLEKTMYGLSARPDFRLILTSEMSGKLPKTLLKQSLKLMFEAPKGVRSSLLRSLQAMPNSKMNKAPVERARVYFLLAWAHSIIIERLRFAPIGWSKVYEFSDADQICAMNVLDEWVSGISKGERQHINPENIPWESIRSILAETTYGGKIDNEFDQQVLDNILTHVFTPKSFSTDFQLCNGVNAPEGTSKEHFEEWVRNLPSDNNPTWLGLSQNAEDMLLTSEAALFSSKILRLNNASNEIDDEQVDIASDKNDSLENIATSKPKWMISVENNLSIWKSKLNTLEDFPVLSKEKLVRCEENISSSIFRSFERESNILVHLLTSINDQFDRLMNALRGNQRMTNDLWDIAHCIRMKHIPKDWNSILKFGNKAVTIELWLNDFINKATAFKNLLEENSADNFQLPVIYNIGNLFQPGAFLTATRQHVAKTKGVSLEDLHLIIHCNHTKTFDFNSNIILEGGKDQPRQKLTCNFEWQSSNQIQKKKFVRLPMYVDSSRSHLLSEVFFDGNINDDFILRSVAIISHETF